MNGFYIPSGSESNSLIEIIISLQPARAYTEMELGGHHGSENQVLHFLRERSPLCHSPSLSVLRGCDLRIHVMLSQALIALLLMAGILTVCTLTTRYHW
jgi:hypothetical protein